MRNSSTILVLTAAILCSASIAEAQPPDSLRARESEATKLDRGPLLLPNEAGGTEYWFVSTRSAAQHRLEKRGPLTVYRSSQGTLSAASLEELQSALTPGVPICIFVHGSFTGWNTQLRNAPQSSQWIRDACPGRPMHVIFFSWPSDGPYTQIFPVDLTVRAYRAEFNGFYLAQVVALCPQQSPVCLIGHSHGTRAVLAAGHLLGGGMVEGLVSPSASASTQPVRAVLMAAAVDHTWLNPGSRYGCALHRIEVMSLRSSGDFPLQFYPLSAPHSRPALAQVGFTNADRRAMGPLGYRAVELDVSELVGTSHAWRSYSGSPSIAAAVAPFALFLDNCPTSGLRESSRLIHPND